jgi:hypothetical protein
MLQRIQGQAPHVFCRRVAHYIRGPAMRVFMNYGGRNDDQKIKNEIHMIDIDKAWIKDYN